MQKKNHNFYSEKYHKCFCIQCKEKGPNCDCNDINVLSKLPKKKDLVKKLENAKSYLYFIDKYDTLSKSSKPEKDLIRSLKEYNSINQLLIKFSEIILYNYNERNYTSIINAINSTNFIIKDINKEKNCREIISLYISSYILEVYKEREIFPIAKWYAIPVKNYKEISSALCICLLFDKRIAIGDREGKIIIINIEKDENELVIKDIFVDISVNSLTSTENNQLIACSKTNIKILKINYHTYTYELIADIKKDAFDIRKVIILDENRFCTSSTNGKICNINPPYNILGCLTLEGRPIESMIKLRNKNIIVSSSSKKSTQNINNLICFWNLCTTSLETCIQDSDIGYGLLEIEKNVLVSVGFTKFVLIDIQEKRITKIINFVIKKFDNFICSFAKFDNQNIFFCDGIGKLYSLNIEKEEIETVCKFDHCDCSEKYHEPICCLKLNFIFGHSFKIDKMISHNNNLFILGHALTLWKIQKL